MIAVPSLPIATAKLPATYEAAKQALANCASIDECRDWANKAEALASYARQADDPALFAMAKRIQARAVRRAGEVLRQIDGKGRNQHSEGGAAADTTQREAAEAAGMSKRQQVTAVRIANIPEDKFDEAVEGEAPPTITALSGMGKNSRPIPEGFREATQLLGTVRRFSEFCSSNNPELVAGGVLPSEVHKIRNHVSTIDAWLDRFVVNLKG